MQLTNEPAENTDLILMGTYDEREALKDYLAGFHLRFSGDMVKPVKRQRYPSRHSKDPLPPQPRNQPASLPSASAARNYPTQAVGSKPLVFNDCQPKALALSFTDQQPVRISSLSWLKTMMAWSTIWSPWRREPVRLRGEVKDWPPAQYRAVGLATRDLTARLTWTGAENGDWTEEPPETEAPLEKTKLPRHLPDKRIDRPGHQIRHLEHRHMTPMCYPEKLTIWQFRYHLL